MAKAKSVVTADKLLDLLLIKHRSDVTVPECKSGPTWSADSCPRLDLWALKRSYTKPCMWGYEIKVNRSDFVHDDKWMSYLPYCNEFYFVAPPDVIKEEEIGSQAGLLISSRNGTRLYKKKKAPYREIEDPVGLFTYILMSRAKIGTEYEEKRYDEAASWKKWLAQKDENKELGYRVSGKIRELVRERIDEVECENRKIIKQNERYDKIKILLKGLGFDDYEIEAGLGFQPEQKLQERLDEINRGIGKDFVQAIGAAINDLTRAQEILQDKMKGAI